MAAGYSSTPLGKKLGLKEGMVVGFYHEPAHYRSLFADWPLRLQVVGEERVGKDLIHFFATSAEQLQRQLPILKKQIEPHGAIWISWPKKAAKMPTDLTEDIIRQLALATGLVDVKVCAVDEVWSGLKLVIPVKNR